MAINDFNNGLIMGLSLQGTIFSDTHGNDIRITLIESNHMQMRIKYNDDIEFTVFNFVEDNVTGILTYFCTKNGATVVFTPMAEEDIIYKAVEV